MKKQSESEWLANKMADLRWKYGVDFYASETIARHILTALKRRGWTPPKKAKEKK